MFLKIQRFSLFLIFSLLLFSCSEYQKVMKSDDVKKKYDLAQRLYEEEDYKRANRLFEQIAPKYVGRPQGERVMFFLANSFYEIEDYNFAGYQFERFLKSYPRSNRAPEAAFFGAKSYYMLSPRYSLDQTDTDKALIKLQNFINAYPESQYLEEANAMAQELTTKKQKKEFEIAKQFNKLGKSYILDYNIAAIAAMDNFISDHPGSIYREEAFYRRLEASTTLALNSTTRRKKERLENAKDAYNLLMRSYPESTFSEQANNLMAQLDEELKAFEETDNISK